MNKLTKKFNRKAITAISATALLGLGIGAGGTAYVANINHEVAPASANHQGTRVWVQYGTLKYALKGPSGRVYPAGTRVARRVYNDNIPANSLPNEPFYLTLIIGGMPGANNLTDSGGGAIAESYVNIGAWNEQDYPRNSVALVNNTMDNIDLSSSDFHPVDNGNPDVPHANTDRLNAVSNDFVIDIDFSKLNKEDTKIATDALRQSDNAMKIGTTQTEVDRVTEYLSHLLANYKKTGHLTDSGATDKPTTPSTNPTTPTTGSGSSTTTPSPTIPTSKSHYVKLRKASYRYTHKGKRVSKKLLKKGSVVKINGKVYRIKGKTFYRIAKNRYIRVVNVAK